MRRKKKNKRIILGIDFGTTNSLVSFIKNKKPEIIVNERGSRTTPSVVNFKNNSTVLVGELAKNQQIVNYDTTITNVKIHLGENISFNIMKRNYSPVEVSALIFRKIKMYAEKYFGFQIHEAVVTVPAYFNDNQRQATMKAGKLAGFQILKLLNEPIAASLAYCIGKELDDHLMVFDLGGGTLDITLMEYNNNIFKVLATGGSTSIGGNNFDRELCDFIVEQFKKETSIDLKNDPIAYQQVLIQSEKAKIDLSSVDETRIFIPYITISEKGPIHLDFTITRETFERIIDKYLNKIKKLIKSTIKEASINPQWLKSIIFAGGSTRIPIVEQTVIKTLKGLTNNEIKVYRDINPEEVVAEGAAVLAGILSEEIDEIKFFDITSHDLGIEDDSGNFITIIPKGSNFPCEKVKLFTTTKDNQREVTIHILQSGINGNNNKYVSLGRFKLQDIQKAKAGEPNIDVTFSIDKHEILNVSALNLDTGNEEKIIISGIDWLVNNGNEDRRGKSLKII